jgi:predicted metal-dependent phosphoesterase TrpH
MAKFDLHLHSNNSDGSASVKELVDTVLKSDIKIFVLTDHDTVAGLNEAEKYVPDNITFIKGVELTCKIDDIKCHILGYGVNPEAKELTELVELGKKLRRQKLETRIKYLKEVWNIKLAQEELDWLYSRKSVVKTHIANILVNRGLSDNNVDAMKKYLDGCKTGNTKFDGIEAIRVIKASGGLPVWAHPLGGEGEEHLTEQEFLPQLKTMKQSVIEGLECFYSRYSIPETSFLKKCAQDNNLIITGGSDWHGTNKTVPIGRLNTDDTEISSDEITKFIGLLTL